VFTIISVKSLRDNSKQMRHFSNTFQWEIGPFHSVITILYKASKIEPRPYPRIQSVEFFGTTTVSEATICRVLGNAALWQFHLKAIQVGDEMGAVQISSDSVRPVAIGRVEAI
jgi:hypothetical protein